MKKLLIALALLAMMLTFLNAQHFENYQILLWDNDFGMQFPDPDQLEPVLIGYEENMIQAFEKLGFSEGNGNLTIVNNLPNPEELMKYAAIFMVSGHADLAFQLLDWEEQEILSIYLDNGGCLYMEGNNIAEFLNEQGSEFLGAYFNLIMESPGNEQSWYDTLFTDSTNNFMHDYVFLFPAGEVIDMGIDVIGARDPGLGEPYFYNILVYNEPGKLYKSAASAYTPPEGTKDEQVKFKTFFSSVSLSGFSYPLEQGKALPDSLENQLIRSAYISDILRWFGMAKTLVVTRTGEDYPVISEKLASMGIENQYLRRSPGEPIGKKITGLYNTVILYTGDSKEGTLPQADIDSLITFMIYGGSVFMIGENIAQAIGTEGDNSARPFNEHLFLVRYFGVDYIAPVFDQLDKLYYADGSSDYSKYNFAKEVPLYTEVDPDWINPIYTFYNNPSPLYFLPSSGKAPAYSGVYNETGHRSIFFSFDLGNAMGDYYDTVLAVSMVDYFGYDTLFDPLDKTGSTAQMNANAFCSENGNSIDFTVYVENCRNGIISLYFEDQPVAETEISKTVDRYTLTVPYAPGDYKVSIKVSDKIVYNKTFSIAEQVNTDIVRIENGCLFVNTNAGDEVKLYDITGKCIWQKISSGKDLFTGFTDLGSGLYFTKINNDVSERTYKVVKL